MTTTTTDTYALNGLVLNTLGWNVSARPMGRHTREIRHQRIPRRAGALRLPSRPQPAEVDIEMWISDRDADGVPGGQSQMWSNVDAILAACGSPDELVTMTRIRGGTTLTAEGELVGPVDPQMLAPGAMQLVLPFVLPYPYWGGAEVSTLLTGGDGTVTNTGQVTATAVVVQLEAGASPWVNPIVTNGANGVVLSYTGTIAAGDTIAVDLFAGTVTNEAGASVSGGVSVNGSVFALAVGANSITTAESSGSGNVRVVFRPPFIL
jgi:hypothetical protein